jgi:uncharacterized protein (DUF983 family)
MFLQRCPRCLRGAVFSGFVAMNESCPTCGYDFGREEGYYTGAMYISYTFALLLLFAMIGVAIPFWHDYSMGGMGILFAILIPPYLLAVPMLFRWSRVVWMHLDYVMTIRGRSDSRD